MIKAKLSYVLIEVERLSGMPPMLAAAQAKSLLKPLGELLEEIVNQLERLQHGNHDQT